MDNAHKYLFWPLKYPNITCSLCNTNEVDTWPHVLLSCPQRNLHALRIKCHNKAIWEICKLLLSSPLSRCLILMNANSFNKKPPDSTIPSRLLPCVCLTPRCQCNSRLCLDLLCVHGTPYLGNPSTHPNPSITIEFIEFTYTNDRYPKDKINAKTTKYLPLTPKGLRVFLLKIASKQPLESKLDSAKLEPILALPIVRSCS